MTLVCIDSFLRKDMWQYVRRFLRVIICFVSLIYTMPWNAYSSKYHGISFYSLWGNPLFTINYNESLFVINLHLILLKFVWTNEKVLFFQNKWSISHDNKIYLQNNNIHKNKFTSQCTFMVLQMLQRELRYSQISKTFYKKRSISNGRYQKYIDSFVNYISLNLCQVIRTNNGQTIF